MKKVRIFVESHGLTPLENFRLMGHIRYIFFLSRKASFHLENPQKLISGPIFNKNKP